MLAESLRVGMICRIFKRAHGVAGALPRIDFLIHAKRQQ